MNAKTTYNQMEARRGFHGGRMMRYALMPCDKINELKE